MSMARAQDAGSASASRAMGSITPALFTSRSIRPQRACTACSAACTCAQSAMSQASAMAPPGRSAASSATVSADRASSATCAPASAKTRAAAAPIPRLAPVITTT
ncbi:MAG: hypothetical protein A2X69_17250 [Rhodobacteraceae bacterium GWF1_65_7]|nr:MAG: hypothetical protein A2X69_17250 [Rhodobacteraceae bacterium GWF1_65_7]